ncbi:MAG: hypothetical protein WCP21_00840 [Armatimonadota bacterium]
MKRLWLALALAGVLLATVAQAHKPRFSDGTAVDPEHALIVQDPVMSQVYYHEVTAAAPRLWLAFDLAKDQEVYLQLGMPVLDRLKHYRPAMALVGPGLPAIDLPFAVPEKSGGVLWKTDGVQQPQFFHEPFTGTDSWILKETRTKVPQTGRYYAVAFVPAGTPGKLWLAIGTEEKFGSEDWGHMAEWTKKVRAFHEVAGAPG